MKTNSVGRLTFKEVKAHAISFLLELEKLGRITRTDGFQGILNAIASDVRSKHRKRLQRQQEMASMNDALKHLHDRKKYFEEQIDSYHNYVEAAMATMQRGKGYDSPRLAFSLNLLTFVTGKIASFCHSPSNTFIFAIFRNPVKPRNLARLSIVQKLYMRKASCCQSTNSPLASSIKLTSSFHQIRRESSQWRYTTIP